ncbi:MAG: hypothetical protein ACM3MF_02295 [Anaerolineae bacterium]
MAPYKICVVGGHCGLRMMMVAEHVGELLREAGYACEVSHQSLWDHPTPPRSTNLILELLPAYTEAEAGCPVINIRPFIKDIDDARTIDRIFEHMRVSYPPASAQFAAKLHMPT